MKGRTFLLKEYNAVFVVCFIPFKALLEYLRLISLLIDGGGGGYSAICT